MSDASHSLLTCTHDRYLAEHPAAPHSRHLSVCRVTCDPEMGIRDPETRMSDPEMGMGDPETRMSDPELGMSDSKTGISDPETGMSDPEMGMSDPETGMSDPETGMELLDECSGRTVRAHLKTESLRVGRVVEQRG